MTKWTIENMPDQQGKLAVITGANSGIGYEAARALAAKGAQVVLACRNVGKGEDAARAIRNETPAAQLEVMALDLADLSSVRAFTAEFQARHNRLDMLINNAGVMALPYRRTADGFEMQFGTNHLGHFALTGLLLPTLLATPGARVVTVSSGAHQMGTMRFDDLQWENGYSKWRAYGMSKLANLLFTYELQRKLTAAGADTIAVACHPGYSATNLQLAGPEMEGSSISRWLSKMGNSILAQDQAMGALPTLYAATMPDVQGGAYYGPDGLMEMRGYPKRVESNDKSHDEEVAARLWQVSEELTGVVYPLAEKMSA
jgi:NAD(P)-dependent dehydrogenase (short-subunit alcohol dehydrogenase family)